jgi:hypothetical protein
MKDLAKKYYQPTPVKWRVIGDVIQDIGIVVGSVAAFTAAPWVPVAAVILGRLGKIITNFNT